MLRERRLVVQDPYSYTPLVEDAINQQWLAQLAWGAIYQVAGVPGLLWTRVLVVAGTLLLLRAALRAAGIDRRVVALAVAVGSLLMFVGLAVRAQLFALLLAALTLWLLQRGGRGLAAIVPVAALWANVHGSFPLAVGFPLAYALGALLDTARRRAWTVRPALSASRSGSDRPSPRAASAWNRAEPWPAGLAYALAAAGAAVATLATPYGPRVWRYAVAMGANDELSRALVEWGPSTPTQPPGSYLVAELALLLLLAFALRPRVPTAVVVLSIGATFLGFSAARYVVWAGMSLILLWGYVLHAAAPRVGLIPRRSTPPQLALLGAAMLSALAIWNPATLAGPTPLAPETPVALADYLAERPGPRLFHDSNWGAYLAARLGPASIFVDGRYEIHPPRVWEDYRAVASARFDWEEILDRYEVRRIALNPAGMAALQRALERSGTWERVWSDAARSAEVWERPGA